MIRQSFPQSCAFAAVGGLLERRGIPAGDRDVARWTQIPWIWERIGDAYATGSWLADNRHLNVATQRHGLSLVGGRVPRAEAVGALREHDGWQLLGIASTASAGHAVLVRREGTGWEVENIGRDGAKPGWRDTDATLSARFRDEVSFAWLEEGRHAEVVDVPALRERTREDVVPAHHAALLEFWDAPASLAEVSARRDDLLWGLALEGPGLMGVAGEEELAQSLARLQLALVEALRAARANGGDVRLAAHYPTARLERLLRRYAAAMGRGFVD